MSWKLAAALLSVMLPVAGIAGIPLSKSGIPFEAASVAQDDGKYIVAWHARGVSTVTVFAGTSPGETDRRIAAGKGVDRIVVQGLPARTRWYFKLVGDQGHPLVIADRSLHLSSASNFRDVGGYRTVDGKWVRMGVAYRSNGLGSLDAHDYEEVKRLGLRLICDLRLDGERRRLPDPEVPGSRNVVADVAADSGHRMTVLPVLTASGDDTAVLDFMKGAYRDFVYLPSARQGYRLLFQRLADPSSLPTVFHCTAGKDRTGWGTAVLLSVLGVPRATIVQDFVLTDRFMSTSAVDQIRRSLPGADQSMTKTLLSADPMFLDTAFREVDERYGSFDRYLHEGLGLDSPTLAGIRANFLAD